MMKFKFLLCFYWMSFHLMNAQTAYRFDGVDDYATITKTGTGILNNYSSPHDFTIEIRFKFNSTPSGPVVSMHSSPANGFFIEFVPNTTTLKAGMGYNGDYLTRTSSSLVQGTWYTAALVYNRTSNAFKYYLDGVLVETEATLPSAYYPETTYAIAFAKSLRWGGACPISVDFFRIWTNQQSQSELTTNKSVEVSCSSSNLLLQYRFDYASGSTVMADCTSNNNNGVLYGATVLPIELLDFKGTLKGNTILLTWQTASELNNEKFVIEASQNGQSFQQVGSLKGKGTTTEQQEYYFKVENAQNGISYYRLKQVDFDGRETFSKVISVVQTGKGKGLNVYPNPVSSLLTIENTVEEPNTDAFGTENDFQIFNLLGQQVLNGNATQRIDVSALPQGIYLLKRGTEQVKFTKQ